MLPAALHPDNLWRPLDQRVLPAPLRDWMSDPGSLTARLQRYGRFRVAPGYHALTVPDPSEQHLLGLPPRQRALIREVTLLLDDIPVVAARSVLPLTSLRGANRVLGNMGSRSLGSELYRRPPALRDQVWVRYGCPPHGDTPCWGRQSRFLKRHQPLLVAEYFLPALWDIVAGSPTAHR